MRGRETVVIPVRASLTGNHPREVRSDSRFRVCRRVAWSFAV